MTLALSSVPAPSAVNYTERTIRGLIVPYNKIGSTNLGRLVYQAGSLRWTDPTRVKLLTEHAPGDSVGHGVVFTESASGMHGLFHVPPTPAGDIALANAASKVRDGLSIGVQLDDAVLVAISRARGAAVMARGHLRETSLVAVPAYDDARISAVA